jgi:hypothetical protein
LAWVGDQVARGPVDPEQELTSLTGGDHLALHLLLRRVDGLSGRPHPVTCDLFSIRTVRHLYFFYLYADSAPSLEER